MKNEFVTVYELTNTINYLLKEGIGFVSVIGEISNYKQHSSGHRYFTLKDENAQISAVLWKTRVLNFVPQEGMKVIITGQITVYPPRGQYQLDCITIQAMGKGDLYFAYEELKNKLNSLGYFDKSNKKPIPSFPTRIGVITSPTGAVIRDIISTIERRMPNVEIYFRPCEVQGENASNEIANAINELNNLDLDIIICGRGGGSIEDLWAFNTETVAKAIFNSQIPIISAVGHETDFTIADFVADLRAATPTAAAELVTPMICSEIINFIDDKTDYLTKLFKSKIEEQKNQIQTQINSYSLRKIADNFNIEKQRLDENLIYLQKLITQNINNLGTTHLNNTKLFKSLYPLSPLYKGFAILKNKDKIISNNDSLGSFDNIEIERLNEKSIAKIISTNLKE